jgi:hypothetical protein
MRGPPSSSAPEPTNEGGPVVTTITTEAPVWDEEFRFEVADDTLLQVTDLTCDVTLQSGLEANEALAAESNSIVSDFNRTLDVQFEAYCEYQ